MVGLPTYSKPPQSLLPEDKKQEEAGKILNTERDSSSIKHGYKSLDQSSFSELVERSHVLGPQFNDAHNHQESSSLHTGLCVCVCVCVCGLVGGWVCVSGWMGGWMGVFVCVHMCVQV